MSEQPPALELELEQVRCPHCNRRLFDIAGFAGIVRIVCSRCGRLVKVVLKPEASVVEKESDK